MELRTKILEADDLPIKEVKVPEWNCNVFVRMMTAEERDKFEARQMANPMTDVRARIAAATVCDEHGTLLFSELDIPALNKKSARALDRVFAAATKHNAITAQDIDDLKKNS
jgi:hypothetical protein